ncbi:hypothetical protein EGI22_22185 [Lacihabitans sp. LS3-19]|uniref:hypothetical protein n=1 Tax=Lacihabitans sp. LS3-19 TaxID=2487335 RepID=UPI0020CD2C4A|nr:hypothetical protein [Lacihabitans sp. LS3-19]MCP9770626.1 hypothetical protein [Lacihabitans sp. LS3-19]
MTAHSFHIPVMGLGYTVETPAKVAHFGISSVISIVEDNMIEKMRKLYFDREGLEYNEISVKDEDYRAKRITSYLNVIKQVVDANFERLKSQEFEEGTELTQYFDLLPENADLKKLYLEMLAASDSNKEVLGVALKSKMVKGSIDVNIMTKLDKFNYDKNGEQLAPEYCDAMAALRGFALSDLNSGMVFSAGMNPRLFSYCTSFPDFFPDKNSNFKKQIILKVSDYRSALIQGKFLAKKGLWVSEFRIESGLNCGGHAFASGGTLLGPIMEEFKAKKQELIAELKQICEKTWSEMGLDNINPALKITVQGGVGTANEHNFLLEHYQVDSVGWGSPFLMVPEVVSVDNEALSLLVDAKKEDYYLSDASPLGVPFNNVRNTSSELLIQTRMDKNRPGSPCYKKFLQFDTEFTKIPICTASREYQNLKEIQMKQPETPESVIKKGENTLKVKECLCEGLASSALLANGIQPDRKLTAVSICPGPNLAYFSGIFSMKSMIGHIYGRENLLNNLVRPHMFVNELELNVKYLKNQIRKFTDETIEQQNKYVETFKNNLFEGINYYKELVESMKAETKTFIEKMKNDLTEIENELVRITVGEPVLA